MSIQEERKQFAKVIDKVLDESAPNACVGSLFNKALVEVNPLWYDERNITDKSLNAAWNFCDFYFDALGHGFEDCAGIPIKEAESKLDNLKTELMQGAEITDSDVLEFYSGPP